MDFAYQENAGRTVVTKAATATLVPDELNGTLVVADTTSGAVALTLPAASAEMDGYKALIVDAAANALTIVVAAGFGAVGAGGDTLTLARGEMAMVLCSKVLVNGTDVFCWFALYAGALG